jgi:hypothetical protein
MNQLLALCARVELDPSTLTLLAQEANSLADWSEVLTLAGHHGLGPLLYAHLKAAGVSPPLPVRQTLQGLYLRHRHANQVRERVLAEILKAYQAAGIPAVALKGAALAYLIYPEPGLRPMRDIDLLVAPPQARQAQQVLTDIGFTAPLPPAAEELPGKHLPLATRYSEGLTISIEVHHNLFNVGDPDSMTLDDLTAPLHPVTLAGITAYALPCEEMLWHLCRHLFIVAQPFRLIWLADVVGLAERFAEEIDWVRVKRRYPLVLSTLSLFHFVTPLSERLRQAAGLEIGPVPQGLGMDFEGWPRTSIRQQRNRGKKYSRILVDTLAPSEWWLRLYYGLGSTRPLFWRRWVTHPLRVAGWISQELIRQGGKRKK